LASFLAIAVLRGDNRIECGIVTEEYRPVTIEDVISPVPMNPSFISEKAKCVEIRSALAIVGFPVEDLAGARGLEAAASAVTESLANVTYWKLTVLTARS
jgi:hypothetical protein